MPSGWLNGDFQNPDIRLRFVFLVVKDFKNPCIASRIFSINSSFRGETFNAFNHADFGLPGRAVGGPGLGIISDATDARVLQLGVRIVF